MINDKFFASSRLRGKGRAQSTAKTRRREESRSVFPALSTNLILRLKSPSVNHEVVQHQAVGNTQKRNGPEEPFAEQSSLVTPPRPVKNPPLVPNGPTRNQRQHNHP